MCSYNGRYISGSGDEKWLRLLDDSFSMLRPTPHLPYLQMLWSESYDTFKEGFIWGEGFWAQNSYGFALGALPLLSEKWLATLQNSLDLFWDRMGDGKRLGYDSNLPGDIPCLNLIAPDGALGDCVFPDQGIVYKQGDGEFDLYDWFYEASAALLYLQCELLLLERDTAKIETYLPSLLRTMNHIESTRAENGLYLVAPGCNLLAPSFGGSYDKKSQTLGKGYLTGLAVTGLSALRALGQVALLVQREDIHTKCSAKSEETLAALPLLMTDEGYFAKSMDPDGTLHGVFGAEEFGYIDGTCNVDAIALRAVGIATATAIYKKIASVEGLRPADVLCANYPHLDDTYKNHLNGDREPNSLGFNSGDWVDGGCWATVEGRAILAYMRLEKYEDVFKSTNYYMRWAQDYRQDAPLSQWGKNTHNPWAKESSPEAAANPANSEILPIGVMIDNFGPVTALLRGLFGYRADHRGLWLTPRVPPDIKILYQHEPVRFAGLDLFISYRGGKRDLRLYVGQELVQATHPDMTPDDLTLWGELFLSEELLRHHARNGSVSIHIDMTGIDCVPDFPAPLPLAIANAADLPPELIELYNRVLAVPEPTDDHLKALRETTLEAFNAAALRRNTPPTSENFRPMTAKKVAAIYELYDTAAASLAKGYLVRTEREKVD